eukprot:g60855.t1
MEVSRIPVPTLASSRDAVGHLGGYVGVMHSNSNGGKVLEGDAIGKRLGGRSVKGRQKFGALGLGRQPWNSPGDDCEIDNGSRFLSACSFWLTGATDRLRVTGWSSS